MGKANNELNHYLRDNQVFADVINLSVYGGNKVIVPDELEDVETVLYPRDPYNGRQERRNDVSKRWRDRFGYQIFCLENERKVSHIMPVRGMEYEAGRYREQLRRIAAGHKKEDYRDWGELSSGFTREDRLWPIVTLVLYWRRETWDGARSLLDMFRLTNREKEVLAPFLQDYKLNLVNMYDLKNTEGCESQLKYILRLLQLDDDKEAMYREAASDPAYGQLEPDTGKVISVLLGDKDLQKLLEEQNTEGGKVGMCKALDDMKNDAKMQGRMQGESCFARLTECLLNDARMEDLKKAIKDAVFRDQLYREYGIGA